MNARALVRVALVTTMGALPARAAAAVDTFEIQVYDGSLDAPARASLEVHANAIVAGRTDAPPPELPPNHQTHLTFEPAIGVTRFWELGGYLQTSLRGDGSYDYAGVKLRSKLVWRSAAATEVRFGINLELSRMPVSYDADRWSGELRPIVAWQMAAGRFAFAVNPIVDLSLAQAGERPRFEPALSAVYLVRDVASFGIEYYADFGAVGRWTAFADQEHYVYEVVNVLRWARFELNAGVGEGLTPGANRFTAKLIVGIQ